ncbi:gag-like protein [Anopheles sinensis]|uniref:Gag-like protein n=1 Tax=Anopheles sinensis TaxID=74873 RepID=A0A084WUZ4_ANOSI|nr:gag-like protein [Anopheles sinensis]
MMVSQETTRTSTRLAEKRQGNPPLSRLPLRLVGGAKSAVSRKREYNGKDTEQSTSPPSVPSTEDGQGDQEAVVSPEPTIPPAPVVAETQPDVVATLTERVNVLSERLEHLASELARERQLRQALEERINPEKDNSIPELIAVKKRPVDEHLLGGSKGQRNGSRRGAQQQQRQQQQQQQQQQQEPQQQQQQQQQQEPQQQQQQQQQQEQQQSDHQPMPMHGHQDWTVVKKRGRVADKGRSNHRPTSGEPPHKEKRRANAVLLTLNEGVGVSEISLALKQNPAFGAQAGEIERIRTTHNGQVLMELKKDATSDKTLELQQMATKLLDGKATARAMTPTISLVCTGIDITATKEELARDLSSGLQCSIPEEDIRSTTTSFGTQVAFFRVPTARATAELLATKVKVGWSRCTIHREEVRRRCFRCQEWGHIAIHCRGKDRSGYCPRCAEDKHEGRCTAPRKCLACKGTEAIGHSIGQRGCLHGRKKVNLAP